MSGHNRAPGIFNDRQGLDFRETGRRARLCIDSQNAYFRATFLIGKGHSSGAASQSIQSAAEMGLNGDPGSTLSLKLGVAPPHLFLWDDSTLYR